MPIPLLIILLGLILSLASGILIKAERKHAITVGIILFFMSLAMGIYFLITEDDVFWFFIFLLLGIVLFGINTVTLTSKK